MFIIIEQFGGAKYASIVTDFNGNNKVFKSRETAQLEAEDCEDGIVIEI